MCENDCGDLYGPTIKSNISKWMLRTNEQNQMTPLVGLELTKDTRETKHLPQNVRQFLKE